MTTTYQGPVEAWTAIADAAMKGWPGQAPETYTRDHLIGDIIKFVSEQPVVLLKPNGTDALGYLMLADQDAELVQQQTRLMVGATGLLHALRTFMVAFEEPTGNAQLDESFIREIAIPRAQAALDVVDGVAL
jgi:hypothetical protein